MFEREERANNIIKNFVDSYDLVFFRSKLMSIEKFFNLLYLETNFYTGTLQAYQVEKRLRLYINSKDVTFKKAINYFGFPYCFEILEKIYEKEQQMRKLNKFVG